MQIIAYASVTYFSNSELIFCRNENNIGLGGPLLCVDETLTKLRDFSALRHESRVKIQSRPVIKETPSS